MKGLLILTYCFKRHQHQNNSSASQDSRFRTLNMDKFLNDLGREKPIRFTPLQLTLATDSYSHLLGVGSFGAVYKGAINNGKTLIAVKVLRPSSDYKRIEEHFMAEMGTIGNTHHINLVRLYGFCYERDMRALVYEYMENSSLDGYLFHEKKAIEWEKLHEIAVGTAKGIAHLHEECQQRIVHYDIKPGNVLLDAKLQPKVSDFGLARLCNRDVTHLRNGGRGTPGYAAPELWMPFPVTYKCDVYSYGMLLFEILGRRRNLDASRPTSQEWFPMWVWKRYEKGELEQGLIACGIEEKYIEKAQRMAMVALWCVQYLPVPRPCMSIVVKMLEGEVEVPPPSNPFNHMVYGSPVQFDYQAWAGMSVNAPVFSTPIMKKYEIELATS